jgi:hypothetical protein
VIRLVSSRLPDETSEQVRRSHHEAIEELQREIRALRASAGRPGWEYIDTTEHKGAATDKVILRGDFNADRDREYLFEGRILPTTGTNHRIRFGPRGSFSETTYDGEVIQTTTASTPTNELWITGTINAPGRVDFSLWVTKRPNGGMTYYGHGVQANAVPGGRILIFAGEDANTANINAWAFGSDNSTVEGGSTVTAWRRRRR